jgi:hypothetical protein
MSIEREKRSDEGEGRAEADSVFDFLYQDRERVGVFLAQLDKDGLLQSYKRSVQAAEGRSSKFTAGGGANVGVANLKGATEDAETESAQEGSERTYDPIWTNALSLLDLLEQRGMTRRGARDAHFGEVVLVQGTLHVLDITMLKGAWELPSVRAMILSGVENEPVGDQSNRHQRRSSPRQPPKNAAPDPISLALDLLGLLPHSVQARIESLDEVVWASLKKEGLVTPSTDLTLNHGVQIPGKWAMIGVLDARPDVLNTEVDAASQLTNGVAATMLSALAPATRLTLGRPAHAFGMTPLLIFRQIGRED